MKCTKMFHWENILTVNEAKQQKAFIKVLKHDWQGFNTDEMAVAAIRKVVDVEGVYLDKVIESSMEACKNDYIPYDNFGEGCGCFDGWINALAKCYDKSGQPFYLEIGFQLSDALHCYNNETDKIPNEYWYYSTTYFAHK